MIKILVADGQELTAAGLNYFFAKKDDVRIVEHVREPDLLSQALREHQPDVLMVDYNLPGSFSINDIRSVSEFSANTHVLVISSDNEKSNIMEVLEAGVKGFITKECSREEVMLAVQSTAKGEKFFCHKVLDILMEKHLSRSDTTEPTVLTSRETEVLQLIASGNSTQQIADMLHLSAHTIHTHRKNIIRKLNIKSPTQFVIYAMDLGLIKSR